MNAREKYAETVRRYNARRPTVTITTQTGAEFVLRKLDAVEVVKVFEIMGVSMDNLQDQDKTVLGGKMFMHMNEILEKIVAPLSVKPRLLGVHEGQNEIADGDDDVLFISDLEPVDKSDLIQKLIESSQGAEGQALGEAFRNDTTRPPGGPAGG